MEIKVAGACNGRRGLPMGEEEERLSGILMVGAWRDIKGC